VEIEVREKLTKWENVITRLQKVFIATRNGKRGLLKVEKFIIEKRMKTMAKIINMNDRKVIEDDTFGATLDHLKTTVMCASNIIGGTLVDMYPEMDKEKIKKLFPQYSNDPYAVAILYEMLDYGQPIGEGYSPPPMREQIEWLIWVLQKRLELEPPNNSNKV
jgi:hypothetical protein